MDFHGLKRKKLQSLCKKHGIPANLKNSEMAERLYALLKDEKPTKRGKSCLKNLNDVETDEEVVPKRVKFSPQNETFFFEKTDPREMRLLARKERGFQKPEVEENPVSFSGNSSVGEVKNVGNVEKPAERIQRRKSVVVNSDTNLNSKAVNNAAKPVERVLSRRSVVVKPNAVLQPKIVDDVVKPVERIFRRKSVVAKANAVLDSKIVDTVVKPVERVLRRKSVVGNVEKQCGERGDFENNLRSHGKKTGVEDIVLSPCTVEGKLSGKGKGIGEQGAFAEADRQPDKLVDLVVERKQLKRTKLLAEIAVNGDNGVGISERNSLAEEGQVRRSARQVQNVTAPGCKSGSKEERNDGVLDQVVAKKVQQKSPEMGPEAKKGKRGRKTAVLIDCSTENPGAVEDIVLSPCIEEGKLSRKGKGIGEQGAFAEADRQPDNLVDLVVERKQLKRTKLLAEIAVNADNGVGISERNSLAEEGQVRRSARQVQNVKAPGCKSGSKKERNDGVLDQAVAKKVQQKSPEMGPEAKKGKRGRKTTVLIDCSAENPGAVETGYVVDKETIPGDSAPAQSLSESEEHNIDEQYHATGHSISAEKKVENAKESTDLSPKSSEKLYVMFNTLEDCKDKRDSIDKVPKKAVDYQGSLLLNSGNIEAEGPMQDSKVKESFVADKSCYNDTAFTPPSNLKGQFSDTMFDFLAEQTCAGADEPTCHSTLKPSVPGSDEVDDSVREQESGASGELRGGMSDSVIDTSEELTCYNQIKNELLSKQEHECEKSPCLSDSSKNENAVDDEVLDCASVISERSNAKPVEQELAAGSCDGKFREVEQTFPELILDLGSSHFISEQVVLVPEASIEANVQSPIVAKRLSLSSNALAATLIKPMEEGKDINVVKQTWFCGIDSSSSNGEDPHVVQLRNRYDDEARENLSSIINTYSLYLQSEVDGEISVLSGSLKKGEDSCKETRRGEIACSENSIKVNTFAEEDNPIFAEQLDEVNVNLEAAGNIMTNSKESNDLKSEKAAWVPILNAFPMSNGGKTPVLFQERNLAQVAYEGNVCPGVMGSTRDKAFECISDKTKYLKQTSVDAVKDIKHDISFPKNNCSDPVNSEDRELSEASHPENAVCLDVESIWVEASEHNLTVDTTKAIGKLEFHLEDDDTSADRKILLQKETFHQLGNLCDNFNAQSSELSVLSGSMMEESHKETPRGDVTCLRNDGNVKYVSESDKYITNMQQEDPKCFYESHFQNLVSVDDITNYSQSEDLESERIACTTEENLRALCDEVETPVLFQKRKPTDLEVEGNTLVYDAHSRRNVSECIKSVSEQTKDLEHIVADDAEDRNDDVIFCAENNVITFSESSYLKNAISSGDFKSISSEISENNLMKGTVDETSAYVNNYTCNIPVKPMVNQMPKVSHARDASPFTTQEKTDFRLKKDNFIAQASKSADLVEKKVETLAQETEYVEEAEGASTCGNESPESINCDKLDGALGQTSTQQTTSVGLVKEFEYLFKQAGSVVGATEGANSYEKESSKSNSERESGEVVELGVVVPEEGKSDVRVCSGHSAGKDFGSCCSLKTNYGNSSLGDAALVLDDDAGTIVAACPPIDRKSTCYFADVCAATSVVASDSLQISEENKWNEVLQNACIGDIEGLHSGEPVLFIHDKKNKVKPGDKVEPESEKSDAYASSRDTEYQGLTSSPFSVVNGKKVGTESNYDADIAEPREDNVYSPMVESHSFCENEKGASDIEVALEYVPEDQIDSHMTTGHSKGQESFNEEKIDFQMELVEEDACTNDNDDSASSRSEGLDRMPCDIVDISDVNINIVHEKSLKSEAHEEIIGDEVSEEATKRERNERIYTCIYTCIGNYMLGQKSVDGQMDTIHKDACMTEMAHSVLEVSDNLENITCAIYAKPASERIVHRETSSSAYDYTQEIDSTNSLEFRDAQDGKGGSVGKEVHNFPLTPPSINAKSSEPRIAMYDVLQSSSSHRFVDEMVQNVLSDYPFTLLDQEKDVCCRGNSKPSLEDGKEHITHFGKDSDPLSSISEDKGMNLDAAEEIVVHCSVADTVALSNLTEIHDYDASDNKADADFSLPHVSGNFTDQIQEQNYTPLMPFYQQMDPTRSASQPGTNMTPQLENEDEKSNTEFFLFTDSAIDLFWGEIARNEVRELQTKASEVTFSVNEYEIAHVENNTVDIIHEPTVEVVLEPVNLVTEKVVASMEQEHLGDDGDLSEQKLQDGIVAHEQHTCLVNDCNSDEVAIRSEDLDTDDMLMSSTIRRKNTRSILIHGTPKKPPPVLHDMKENAVTQKRMQMVDVTAVKSSFKRKALEDISK